MAIKDISLAQLRKDKKGLFTQTTNNIKDYLKVSGVWAVKGKAENTRHFEYLEVGQSKDIGAELESNLKLLTKDYSTANLKRIYAARRFFPEFQISFDVCVCDKKNRRAAKYRTIATQYSEITFELISTNTCRSEREKIEYKYAIKYHAKYWNAWGCQRREARNYYNKIYK